MESVAQLRMERDQYALQIQEEGRVWKDKTEQLLSQVHKQIRTHTPCWRVFMMLSVCVVFCRYGWCLKRGTPQLLKLLNCRTRSQSWRTLRVLLIQTLTPHSLHAIFDTLELLKVILYLLKICFICLQFWWTKSKSLRLCHRAQDPQKVKWPFRKPSAVFSRNEILSVYSIKHRWPSHMISL